MNARYKLQAWLNQWEVNTRAAKKMYRDSEKELAIIQEMYLHLHAVRLAIDDGDYDTAVFQAVQYGIRVGESPALIEAPKARKKASSKGGEHKPLAAVIRYANCIYNNNLKKGKADAARRATNKAKEKGYPITESTADYIARQI